MTNPTAPVVASLPRAAASGADSGPGLREQVEAGLLLAAEHCSKVRDEYEKQGKHREATICRMLKGEIMALAGKKGWDRSRFCTVCGHDSHSGMAHGPCGGTPTRCGRCGKPKHDGYCIGNNTESLGLGYGPVVNNDE